MHEMLLTYQMQVMVANCRHSCHRKMYHNLPITSTLILLRIESDSAAYKIWITMILREAEPIFIVLILI